MEAARDRYRINVSSVVVKSAWNPDSQLRQT